MKKLNTGITISRVHCSDTDDYMKLTLRDRMSGIEFIEIKIELKDFAKAITGLGGVDGKTEVRGLENIGKKYEHKTITYEMPKKLNIRNKRKLLMN